MFFEQVMGDLNAYAEHAGRDVVTTGDVELLMHRYLQPIYIHTSHTYTYTYTFVDFFIYLEMT